MTMDQILIYPPNGLRPLFDVPMTKAHKEVCKLGGEHYVELQFSHSEILPLTRGCFINYNNSVYTLNKDAAPEALTSADGYRYTLKFYARQHLMEHRVFRWLTGFNNEVTFSLTTTLPTYAQLLVENMNSYMGASYAIKWIYNAIPTELQEQTQALTFDGVTCWEAKDMIAQAFGVECWVEEADVYEGTQLVRRLVINFSKCSRGSAIDIREGEVVNRFPPARRGEDANYGTRYFVFGGTKNIPEDYYEDSTGGVTNHISQKRLHLPNGREYIDAVEGLTGTEIVERTIILDHIYPKNTDTITGVDIKPAKILEWEDSTDIYIIEAADTAFSGMKSDILGTLGITFTSGALEGRSFDVSINDVIAGETFNRKFEIVAQVEGEDGASQIVVPNQYLKPEAGDTFILTGIKLPAERIDAAERELAIAAQGYVAEYSADTNVYDCPTNPVYCTLNDIDLSLGQKVRLVGAHFGEEGRNSRVQGYEKLLYSPYHATYNIGDNNTYSKSLKVSQILNNATLGKLKLTKQEFSSEYNGIKIMSMGSGEVNAKLDKLIGNDQYMSVREIANEVYDTSYPTEIATATQRIAVTSGMMLLNLKPNILYDWSGVSLSSLSLPSLYSGDNAYYNKWMVRVALISSANLTIPFDVFWRDGIAPSWNSWCICEITFTKDAAGDYTYGEWKIYK